MKAWNNSFKIYFLGFILFEILCLTYALNFSRFDQMRWVNSNHSILFDYLFQGFTFLAEIYLTVFLLIYFFKTKKEFVRPFLFSYALATFITQSMKHWVFEDALRPYAFFKGVNHTWHYVEGVFLNEYNSFPSGHTSVGWFLFFWVAMYKDSKILALFSVFLASGVAYSRVYLFQHFPIDTAFGGLVGFSCASIFYYIFIHSKEIS